MRPADSEGSLNPALLYETAAFFATHNGCVFSLSVQLRHLEAMQRDELIRCSSTDEEQQFVECTERLLHRRIDSTWLLIAFFHTLEDWLRDNAEVRERDWHFRDPYSLSPDARPSANSHPSRVGHSRHNRFPLVLPQADTRPADEEDARRPDPLNALVSLCFSQSLGEPCDQSLALHNGARA